MTTKQTDTVAMTQEQLDGVSGGPHYSDWHALGHNVIQRRRSNRTVDTGRVVAIWTAGGTTSIWATGPVSS